MTLRLEMYLAIDYICLASVLAIYTVQGWNWSRFWYLLLMHLFNTANTIYRANKACAS